MKIRIVLVFLFIGLITETGAELHARGNGMIYDDKLDITWLEDASPGGRMSWADYDHWTEDLGAGGFNDWRLVSMDVNMDGVIIDCNLASELLCRDNELGYMYHQNLGGSFPDDLTGNQGLFLNIQSTHWSGTQAPGSGKVWIFEFEDGQQSISSRLFGNMGAWAVRDGDVLPPDSDSDSVMDSEDNCILVANADQRDTNGDGYGNSCDPDLNNDNVVNFIDVSLWVPFFNTATTGDADFNGDGFANFVDYVLYFTYFLQPPGPSGVAP